jgi:peptidoglycan/xylan/chitin deacetylase (PgdA/CDA1 family)
MSISSSTKQKSRFEFKVWEALTDPYFWKMLFIVLSMVSLFGVVFYQLLPSIGVIMPKKVTIYLLSSEDTKGFLPNPKYYDQNIAKFRDRLLKQGYNVRVVNEDQLGEVPSDGVLFAMDVTYLSSAHLKKLLDFLYNGGNLLFNFTFAYQNGKTWRGPKVITEITGLEPVKDAPAIKRTKNNYFFLALRGISPLLQTQFQKARRIDFALYDPLPLFTSKALHPDGVLTNWQLTGTPYLKQEGRQLSFNEAGVIWHGKYGKGNWFYFNFPSYTLLELPKDYFTLFIDNIITYFKNVITISPYPFLDHSNMVFVSEDTEYKYPNLAHFVRLAHKYEMNVTAFCVAKLAEKYPNLTKEAAQLPEVEIGSHSYSHTKIVGEPLQKVEKEIIGSKEILDKIIGKKVVVGFRPPREEVDKTMYKELVKGGYRYVMEKTKPELFPFPHKVEDKLIWTLPRHGTDDYIYLIELNWNKEDILAQIVREAQFLHKLDALYTLSVHTHLLSYGTNISVIEEFFKYAKAHNLPVYKGKDIAYRAQLLQNVHYEINAMRGQIQVAIINENKVPLKNLTFRVYWNNLKDITGVMPAMISFTSSNPVKIVKRDNNQHYIDIQIREIPADYKYNIILSIDR